MAIPIMIDTDPGIDDAAAISIALTHPDLDLKMITTVHGNVNIHKTTSNALQLKAFFNSNVPIHQGVATPLINQPVDAEHVHGETGMAGFEFSQADYDLLTSDNAVQAMKEALLDSDEPITLVPIGPLTNIALLLKTYPEVSRQIKEIVLMGGSAGRGNVTPAAEFNIYCDPEAADIVFNSHIPITMVGLDVARGASLTYEAINKLQEINQTSHMLYHMFNHYRGDQFGDGIAVYDAYTILYLLYPEMFSVADANVKIELTGTYTKGETVVNFDEETTNATVVLSVDKSQFITMFFEALSYAK